jgi:hypothetical protein
MHVVETCVVTFGDPGDSTMHPVPDPLLLVLRAANNFGIMAEMKMLAIASPGDLDDVSIGDIMEEAFLEAREQSLRPKTWADLAKGLGQPNGYFASIGAPKCQYYNSSFGRRNEVKRVGHWFV